MKVVVDGRESLAKIESVTLGGLWQRPSGGNIRMNNTRKFYCVHCVSGRSLFRAHRPRTLAVYMTTCLLVAAAVGPCATHAVAAVRAWRGTSDAVWTNANNWDDTSSAPGTGDTAIFNDAGNGQTTINLGGGVAISTIQFDTSTAAAYTIGSGGVGSQTLSLDNLGAVTMSASVAANETFNANVLLGTGAAGSWTFTNDSTTNALLFAGAVSGGTGGSAGTVALTVNGAGATDISGTVSNGGASSLALTKSGAGTLTLSGPNTFSKSLANGPIAIHTRKARSCAAVRATPLATAL